MPKGYWIVNNLVTDPAAYAAYRDANAAPFAAYGARFLVRGGTQEVREGTANPRTVVIEFPSLDAARACYDSPAYQAALAIRAPAATGMVIIAEGYGD